MTDKKDILEFPLEDVEVPQAIALMMQAAYTIKPAELEVDEYKDNNERLQQLCEKLEARVEDAIEAGLAPPVLEDAPDEEPVDETDIFLMNEGLTMNYKGLLFHRTCNELVKHISVIDEKTFCALVVDHDGPHVDSEGDER